MLRPGGQCGQAASAGSAAAFYSARGDLDEQLHAAPVIEASGHARLGHILASTIDAPLVFEAFREFSQAELERSNNFHKVIRDRIAERESARAAVLMYEHIMEGRNRILASLDAAEDGGAIRRGARKR